MTRETPQTGRRKIRRKRPSSRPDARPASAGSGGERLQKRIAAAGLASRREAERMVLEGRVRVNGSVVRELGARASETDRISVDGKRLPRVRTRYFLVYKPRGVVTTTRDAHARKTVLDLVPGQARLFPVGRLDAASEGLILLTNDGEAAQALLHPSFEVPRTYKVSVDGAVSGETLRRLGQGLQLDDELTAPCEVQLLERTEARSVIEMTLVQGRRRQIRRMLDAVGHPVRRLLRVRFGPLSLRGLKPGDHRPLRRAELVALERMREQALRSRRAEGAGNGASHGRNGGAGRPRNPAPPRGKASDE